MAEKLPITAVDNAFNEYASDMDAKGIYKVVDYKRTNGTLYMKSTLSNADGSGNYLTLTQQYYDAAGTTPLFSKVWALTYDTNGSVVTKVASA